MLAGDGQVHERGDVVALDARLEHVRLDREELTEVAVAHQQATRPVPQDEGLGHALDGVAQAVLPSLGAELGDALGRYVERPADDAGEPGLSRAPPLRNPPPR